jgi:hypothetical protein
VIKIKVANLVRPAGKRNDSFYYIRDDIDCLLDSKSLGKIVSSEVF